MNENQARDRAERKARRLRRLAIALMSLSLLTASPAAAAPGRLVLQSESGVGHGVVMPRSAALAPTFKTVLLRRHESRHHRFELAAPATFEVRARWSNDSAPAAQLEHVSLILDSHKLIGTYVAQDSGNTGWGYDWNVFLTSPAPIATVTLAAGKHVISTSTTQADLHGYESDAILLDPVA